MLATVRYIVGEHNLNGRTFRIEAYDTRGQRRTISEDELARMG